MSQASNGTNDRILVVDDDPDIRAYVIADNKLALNAGWDEELLATELQGLLVTEIDFDIGVTGFSIPEIDSLIEGSIRKSTAIPPMTFRPRTGPRSLNSAMSGRWAHIV